MNSTHFDQGDIAEVPFFKICLSDERHFHLKVKLIFTFLPFHIWEKYHLNLTIKRESAEHTNRLLHSATCYILRLVTHFLRINLHFQISNLETLRAQTAHLSVAGDSKDCFSGVVQSRQVEVDSVV